MKIKILLSLCLLIPFFSFAQWKNKEIDDSFKGTIKYSYVSSNEDGDVYLVLSRLVGETVEVELADHLYNKYKSIGFADNLPIVIDGDDLNIYKNAIRIRIEGDGLWLGNNWKTQWIAKYNNISEKSGTDIFTIPTKRREVSWEWDYDDGYVSDVPRGKGIKGSNTEIYPLSVACDDFTRINMIGWGGSFYSYDYNPEALKMDNNPLKIINDASTFIFRITSDGGDQTYTFNLSGSSKAISYVSSATKSEKVARKQAEKDAAAAIEAAKIKGCMDDRYLEYNYEAEKQIKGDCKTLKVNGCMDSRADNYSKKATVEDNTCVYSQSYKIKNNYYFYNDPPSKEGNNSIFSIKPDSYKTTSSNHEDEYSNQIKQLVELSNSIPSLVVNGKDNSLTSSEITDLRNVVSVLLFNYEESPEYIKMHDSKGNYISSYKISWKNASYSYDKISSLFPYQSSEMINAKISTILDTKNVDNLDGICQLIESLSSSSLIEIKDIRIQDNTLSFTLIEKSNDGKSNLKSVSQYLGIDFHGERIEYRDGKMDNKRTYDNNKLNGIFIDYYTNGTIKEEGTYLNDKKNGLYKMYYENTNLKEESSYEDGYKSGNFKSYFTNKNLSSEGSYSIVKSQSIQSGKWRTFYENNGQLKTEGTWKIINNKKTKDGLLTSYYENGKLRTERNYKKGIGEGNAMKYYENGQLHYQLTLVNGKKSGKCTWYYDNGNMKVEANFTNDIMSKGPCNYYHKNGKIWYKLKFNSKSIARGSEFDKKGNRIVNNLRMKQTIDNENNSWKLEKTSSGSEIYYGYDMLTYDLTGAGRYFDVSWERFSLGDFSYKFPLMLMTDESTTDTTGKFTLGMEIKYFPNGHESNSRFFYGGAEYLGWKFLDNYTETPFINETMLLGGWQYQPNSWFNMTLDLGIGLGLQYNFYQTSTYVPFRLGLDIGYRY